MDNVTADTSFVTTEEPDEEAPYEEELDGYIYTNSLVDGEGDFEETEMVEMKPDMAYQQQPLVGYGHHSTSYNHYHYPFRRGKQHQPQDYRPHKRYATANGNDSYEWIAKTLRRVDSQYHAEYLTNFVANKVQDHRLADLLPSDWKELIPAIGPRNEFVRLWKKQYAGDSAQRHHGEYDYDDMAASTAPDSEIYSEYTSEQYTEDMDGTSHTESAYLHHHHNHLGKMTASSHLRPHDMNHNHSSSQKQGKHSLAYRHNNDRHPETAKVDSMDHDHNHYDEDFDDNN